MISVLPYTAVLTQGINVILIGIFGTIKSIYNHENPDLANNLRKLDVEYHLRLVSTVLKNQKYVPVITIKEYINDQSIIFSTVESGKTSQDPLEVCLFYLSNSVKDIHLTLVSVNQKVQYHQTKWLNTYRILSIQELLNKLEADIDILKNRFNDFIKIQQIYQQDTMLEQMNTWYTGNNSNTLRIENNDNNTLRIENNDDNTLRIENKKNIPNLLNEI